jgi:hypothetical protein
MKVSVVRGGGLAGVVTATTLDSDDLSKSDAEMLRAKVAAARLDQLAAGHGPSQPDRFSYELTVADGDQHRTVRVREQDLSAPLRDLISTVQTASGRRQEVRRPGAS